jgi:acyl carrier protein
MAHIEQEVRQFVIDNFLFGQSNGHLSDDDSFLEKGLIDSLGILNLVQFVQEKYDIPVEDEELLPENWDSVRCVAKFVQGKLDLVNRTAGEIVKN